MGVLYFEWVVSHTPVASCVQEEIVGKHIEIFYPPTQPNGMRSVDVASAACSKLESGQDVSLEFNQLAADGTTFLCAVQAKVCGVWGVRAMG